MTSTPPPPDSQPRSQQAAAAEDDAQRDRGEVLLTLIRDLVRELYPGKSLVEPDLASSIDADIGLDSLGRMELLRRMERTFNVRIDEQQIVGAETVRDLLAATRQSMPATSQQPPAAPLEQGSASRPDTADTLVEALEWHLERHPDQVHIHIYPEGSEEPAPLRYRDLWEGAGRVAAGLRAHAVAPGDTVAIMLPTSQEFFYAFVGILLAGAVPVPIYPPVRMSQIEDHLRRQSSILSNAGAVILITVTEAQTVGRFLKGRLPQLREVITTNQVQSDATAEIVQRSKNDLALIQYTSGSTGNPKGVMLTHGNLLANIRAMGSVLEVTPTDVFVSWLPLYHDMGLIGAWMGTLYHGIPLVLMSPLSFVARPHRWLWAIHRFGGTLSAAPNFAYDLCARKIDDRDIEGLDLSSWRFTCNGAEPVSAVTVNAFIERFHAYGFDHRSMAPVYGLAECCVGLTFPPLQRGPRIERIQQLPFRTRSVAVAAADDEADALQMVGCGMALPEHEARIVDDADRELPERHMGRLQFRGPSATQGYFRNPEATEELVHDGWLDSGDYAYLDGGEVFITGRAKDLIIRGGRNIYPYDLEEAIGELPGIRKGGVAVFGSLEAREGIERLIILAETRERRPERRQELQQEIERTTLEQVGVGPDEVVLAPPRAVLKTSSGKIRRSACRELYERGKVGRARPVWLQIAHLTMSAVRPLIKRIGRQARSRGYFLYAWFVFFVLAVPTWIAVMVLPGRTLPPLVVRGAARAAMWFTGIGFRVEGREHIPKDRPCVVASNHASYMDALVLGTALQGGFGFVAKRELSSRWFMDWFLRKLGTFYVSRFDPRRSIEDMDALAKAAHAGQPLVFFPEGTFTRAPGLRPFRMGAFVAAAQGGLPVVPVAIRGTRAILRGDEWFPRRGNVEIEFRPPIAPDGGDWEAALRLRDAVRAEILAHCGEPDLA